MFGILKEVDNTLTVDTENRTYTTLGYADGPGGLNGFRQDLRNVDTADKDFLQQATVLLEESESHGSEDVGENWTKHLLLRSLQTSCSVFCSLHACERLMIVHSSLAQKETLRIHR